MTPEIHYQCTGSGQPLVFVPGLTCTHEDWSVQIDDLKDDFRCIAVDTRGHGKSASLGGPLWLDAAADDLATLLEFEQLTNAVLIGHSWGTRASALTATVSPDRVGALVLVDGSQQGSGDPTQARLAVESAVRQHPTVSAFVSTMFEAMFMPDTDPIVRQRIISRATAMPDDIFMSLLTDMVAFDAGRLEQVYEQVRQPVTVIQSTTVDTNRVRHSLQEGEQTPFTRMLQQAMPQARIEIVPGIGHFTQIDAPDRVTQLIRETAAA